MKKISEINKSDEIIKERLLLTKEQGYWECDKCGIRYYAGFNCDPCMAKEYQETVRNPVRFEKMEENLSFYFENGYTIVSDITERQGDIRTVILGWPNAKNTVLFLRSMKIGDSEEFSKIILGKEDVEILSSYFNTKGEGMGYL